MRESVFHGSIHIPVYPHGFRLKLFESIPVISLYLIRRQADNSTFRHHKILLGIGNQRCKVRGDQCTGMGVGRYQGTDLSHCVNFAGSVCKHNAKTICAFQFPCHLPYCLQRISFIKGIQHPGSHLTVCLGAEPSLQMEFRFQLMIIFNNSVMDQSNPSCLVRMGIFFRYSTMSSPPGVADTAVGVRCAPAAGIF